MNPLTHFKLSDIIQLGSALRTMDRGATCMEEVAQRITHHLYNHLLHDSVKSPACPLVRLYITQPFWKLPQNLQGKAKKLIPDLRLMDSMKTLVLLGTSGNSPNWNNRHDSQGHQAIPLPSEKLVASLPMVNQLLLSLGMGVEQVIYPSTEKIAEREQKTYDIFHVQRAMGSPFLPAQTDFIVPQGIQSVVGIGAVFPTGDFFTLLLFTKVEITEAVANLFKTLALSAKIALLPFLEGKIFK